jgi:hypothetical protein
MAGHEIGFVDNSVQLAHYAMLERIHAVATANGWTALRYVTTGTDHELILKGVGFSGTDEIFVGFRTYHSVSADYYNLLAAGFTGYVAGNSFDTQPGARLSGVPAHNQRIDYWLTVNPQRIALAMKVGTPVYEPAYVGKFLPYARPSQYPYPVICAGSLSGAASTRFSDTAHSMGYKGNTAALGMRFNSGAWLNAYAWPWCNAALAGSTSQLRDTAGAYPLLPVVLHDNAANVYGELDGIHFVSGFNNSVESTFVVDGKTYVVFQDVARNGFFDYYAMRLD